MSMIDDQVDELRYKADIYNVIDSKWELNRAEAKILQGLLRKAADTIETLSAKLAAESKQLMRQHKYTEKLEAKIMELAAESYHE